MPIWKEYAGDNKSDPSSRFPCLLMRPLLVSRYAIPGYGWVRCTLWLLLPARPHPCPKPMYAVGMEGLGFRRLRTLGRDGAKARTTYALLVRNTVTPCALGDVLEEWAD